MEGYLSVLLLDKKSYIAAISVLAYCVEASLVFVCLKHSNLTDC